MNKTIRNIRNVMELGVKKVFFEIITDVRDLAEIRKLGYKTISLVYKGQHRAFIYTEESHYYDIVNSYAYDVLRMEAETGERQPRTSQYHLSMGKLLGFPPRAIETFISYSPEDFITRLAVDFCGIRFASYSTTIIEDIAWLYDTYKPTSKMIFNFSIEVNSVIVNTLITSERRLSTTAYISKEIMLDTVKQYFFEEMSAEQIKKDLRIKYAPKSTTA